jgi:alpha-beta hydrolase superfamily lysophospholipase
MTLQKAVRRTLRLFLLLFVFLNVIAIFHAYKFTHFAKGDAERIDPNNLNTGQKIKLLLFGVNNPKPVNDKVPAHPFETIKIKSNVMLECWYIPHDSAKGIVVFFHGYIASKSTQLERAEEVYNMGYNLVMVDFMGSGGSEGYQTTIGYEEAQEVKDVYNYLAAKGEKNIYLFGTSMGAVAILKSLHDYKEVAPKGIIIECPFGSMYKTVCARFSSVGAPTFPIAPLLVFWGGAINGFWAFGHNPSEYARSVTCPVLLLAGGKDERVSNEEITDIYAHLQGKKTLKMYTNAGHESYLNDYKDEWISDVKTFLND